MKKMILVMVVVLGACVGHTVSDPYGNTSCKAQAEAACEPNDSECSKAVLDDCNDPLPCTAPDGQHC